MLALPAALKCTGLIMGTVLMIAAAGSLYLSLYCFCFLFEKYKNCRSYSELAELVNGKAMGVIVNYIFLIYVSCSLISYILIRSLISSETVQAVLPVYECKKYKRYNRL